MPGICTIRCSRAFKASSCVSTRILRRYQRTSLPGRRRENIDSSRGGHRQGRERVRSLRSEESLATDLPEALAQVSAMVAPKATTAIEFIVEGKPRPLRAIVHDEVYYIAREAMTNALLHARASRIEVEIEYAQTHLRIRCRDNGSGMTRGSKSRQGTRRALGAHRA